MPAQIQKIIQKASLLTLFFCLACIPLFAADTTPPTGSILINNNALKTNSTQVTLNLSAKDLFGVSQMQFSNDNITWSPPEAYKTSKTWTIPSGDGTKTVYAKFKDKAGNWSKVYSDTIILDTIPAVISNVRGTSITATGASILWDTDTPATSQVEYGATAAYGSKSAYAAALVKPHTANLSSLKQYTLYHFRVISKDDIGNTAVSPDYTFTTKDSTSPTGTIKINNNAASTNSTGVTLNLSATDTGSGLAQMQFSNDNKNWSVPEAYATTKAWTLSAGSGTKTVYAKFKDNSGNWSVVCSDAISFPNQAPKTGTITPGKGSSAPQEAVSFTVTYSDANGWQDIKEAHLLVNTSTSGLHCFWGYYNQNANKLYLKNDNNTAWIGGFIPGSAKVIENTYAKLDCANTTVSGEGATLTINWSVTFKTSFQGAKNTYLYVKDGANAYNNWAQSGTWNIQTDTIAPTGAVKINNDAQYTKSTAVTLSVSAQDNAGGSGLSRMQYSNDGAAWSAPEAYAASKNWTLFAGDGEKKAYAKFSDMAGNWSAPVSDTIILDATPPEIIITSPPDSFLTNQKNTTINYTVDGQARSEARTLAEGLNTLTVTAADAAGNSAAKSIKGILDTAPPIPPRQLSAVAGNSKAELLWTANSENDLAGYNIYRSQAAGSGYVKMNASPVSAVTYGDAGLVNGTTYFYIVTAVDAVGNESGYSNEVSVSPEGGPSETEPNNDFSSANPIQPGTSLRGNINPPRDCDYFKITVPGPGKLYVTVSGLASSADVSLRLYDASQNNIAQGYNYSGNDISLERQFTSAGDYYIKVVPTSNNIFSYSLQVDFTTLWISGPYASPDPFSPNADGKKDTAVISASATAESNFTINIKDAQNKIIRTFTGSGKTIEQIWDGKDNSGAVAPDGVYTYTVDAVDLAGLTNAPQVSSTITVDNTLPTATITEPVSGAALSGIVPIKGIADDANFRHWVLYLGRGATPAEWDSLLLGFKTQPAAGLLYDWDTASLPNGDYVLKLQVWDKADNIKEFSIPVSLTNSNIYNVSDAPDPFSPNSDGQKDTLIIKASLTTQSNWTINIKDAQNNIKRTFTGSGAAIEQAWDGKDNSGAMAQDGVYTYTIDALDPVSGANSPQVSGQVTLDSTLPEGSISAPAAAQRVSGEVSIYGTATDAHFYYGDLYYRPDSAPADWKYITSIPGALAESGWLGAWNTANIPSGGYTIKLRLYDYAGNIRDIETPVKVYNAGIYNSSAVPAFFSPNGDGQQDITSMRASITALCDWTVNIKNAQGSVIRTFTGSSTKIEQPWDGKDNSGAVAPDGVYTYTIDAVDPVGGVNAAQVSGQVTLDNTLPTASIVTPAPGAEILDSVAVKGLCDDTNFNSWRLSFGQGSAPTAWNFIYGGGTPVGQGSVPGLFSNWAVKSLANGDYVLRLEAWDMAGNKLTTNRPVKVSNSGPDITELTVAPSPFTPDGIDANITDDIANIAFYLADAGFINLSVYDINMNLVKTIYNDSLSPVPGSADKIAFRWDGTGSNARLVRNGEYRVVVSSGSKEASAPVIVNDKPIFDRYKVEPQSFSPDGDGIGDSAKLTFSLSEDSFIKVEVHNSADALVRTLADNARVSAGQLNEYVWDGKNNSGQIAGQGSYRFKVSATAVTGNDAAPLVMSVFLSSIPDVKVSKDTFNPHASETTDIIYTLAYDAKLSIKIRDAQGNVVRELISKQARAVGDHSETWDGKDGNGNILADGYYYFTIEDSITGLNEVVYDPSTTGSYDISHSITFSVSAFDTLKNEPAVLSYTMPRPAKINIKVRANKYEGPALRVIKYQEPVGTGDYQCLWDGRDEFGNILTYSNYTVSIWGYTLSDNAIVIKGGRPVISQVTTEPIKFSPVFNPYASEAQNSTKISFNLSQGANVTLDIYNSGNVLVRRLLNAAACPAGASSISWNGKNAQGQIVPNDYYRVDIQAQKGDNYSDAATAHTEVFY